MKNLTALLFLMSVSMFTSTAQAGYSIYRYDVYTGPDTETNPDIDGDMIVWQSTNGNDIYWKAGDTPPNQMSVGGEQVEPKVSDGIIIWLDRNSDHDVYGYDTVNDLNLTIIENDGIDQREHDISGSTAAYRASNQIYIHPVGGTASLVAPASGARYEFGMHGTIVAWMEMVDAPQIMVRDISTSDPPQQITSGTNWHRNPAVSGNLIVWDQDAGGNDYDIYGYDLDDPTTGVFAICTDPGSQKNPAVSGSIVTWQDESDGVGNYDIWAIDLANRAAGSFEVSDGTGNNQSPAVSVDSVSGQKTIVWDHNGDIVAAELQDPTEVVVTSPNGGESFRVGDSMLIEWTTAGPVAQVLIEFSADGGTSWTDVNTVDDTGSYLWDAVADVDSADCLIKITNTASPGVTDTSDAAFAVHPIPNLIEVLSPNGGEMILAGSEMLITWGYVSGNAPAAVDITFDDGISAPSPVAVDVPFTDYQYRWTPVSDVNSLDACYIHLSDADDGGPADSSDAAFSVFQCDTALTADLTGDCFVDIADVAELARQWLDCGNPHDDAWCLGI